MKVSNDKEGIMLSLSKYSGQWPLRTSFDKLRMTAAPEKPIFTYKQE